ncbi:MAG: PilZ domain-containing protein [Gammaproteobacteria bacterium]
METGHLYEHLPNLLVTLLIFGCILYPRFNHWPENEAGRLIGRPKDYIHRRRYYIYTAFYLSTFALFALALSSIEDLHLIIAPLVGESHFTTITTLSRVLGNSSFAFCLAVVSLALMVPFVDHVDQRWRKTLLTSARVPKESLELKNELLRSLPVSTFEEEQLVIARQMLKIPNTNNTEISTNQFIDDASSQSLVNLLLRTYYIADTTRYCKPSLLDTQNIDDIENRLKEIAAVSHFFNQLEASTLQNYKNEIEEKMNTLLEILAKNCVRIFPDATTRHRMLSSYGFDLRYFENHSIDFIKPAVVCIMGITIATVLTVLLYLGFSDVIGLQSSRPQASDFVWLTNERLFRWSLGGSVSFIVSVAFGVFFNEIMKTQDGDRDPLTYLLAFAFSVLGSCIFFTLSNESFRPPFIWLSISFGLLSQVAIEARDKDLITKQEVHRHALRLALYYAVASAILQVMIRIAFSNYHLPALQEGATLFGFGLIRGGLVAFIVAYVLLETERRQISHTQRQFPRITFRKLVNSAINGKPASLIVRNISENGALIILTQSAKATEGDTVDLNLDFTTVSGRIIWVKNKRAGIHFSADKIDYGALRSFISNRMQIAAY